jgi:hypothetical protein
MSIVKTIVDNEGIYSTIHEKREAIVARLRGKNVQYQDVEGYLLKEARREKYYTDVTHIATAREERKEWIVLLDRYIKWIQANYKAKWEPRVVDQKKNKNVKIAGTVTIPKSVSEAQATKMLENPANIVSLETALIKKGKVVLDEVVTPEQAERLIENEESLQNLLMALEAEGYSITK